MRSIIYILFNFFLIPSNSAPVGSNTYYGIYARNKKSGFDIGNIFFF